MLNWRRIVSSAAILTIAGGSGWAALKCFQNGAGFLGLIGSCLLLVSLLACVVALAPMSIIEKIFGPHRAPNDSVGAAEPDLWLSLFDFLTWW
jgi:hypothetical protein